MSNRVFIIGCGIIAAPGESLDQVSETLRAGRACISPLKNFDSGLSANPLVGEVNYTNSELTRLLNLPEGNYSRTFLLGMFAAKQAIKTSGLSSAELSSAAFISSTTVGGMDRTEQDFIEVLNGSPESLLESIANNDCGATAESMSLSLGIHGFVSTINTACSSAANAFMFAARMIRAGDVDFAIAGGTDALCRFTLNGFNSLMLVSDEECKPFDESRNGLNLGEGAGYLVLCSERVVEKFSPVAELAGWGNANDAYHQTASSPEGRGAALAMKIAMDVAGIHPSQIDYINAHGTATPNNDLAESQAIRGLFGTVPAFSSTKGFTGHTLAAAGAVEAIISILAICDQVVFPNLNFQTPMNETGLVPETSSRPLSIEYVLSNSFGFGGNCSSVIFKKYAP